MKTASISEIKKVLQALEAEELLELCLRIAKYKKDNKELLHFLLYEAGDEHSFVIKVKEEIDGYFNELPQSNAYLIKKGLRKILKSITKYVKYANSKSIEMELGIYFCQKLKGKRYSTVIVQALNAIWESQIKKIDKNISGFHEDLQYDYRKEIEKVIR